MKTKTVIFFFLGTIALCGAGSTYALDRNEYVTSVIEILRAHVNILEELTVAHQFKYSDNLVRHAVAVEDTFGLLGPMEWHAAQAAKLRISKQGSSTQLDEDMFEDLARASRKSLKELVHAAHDSMVEYDRDGILDAINDMKESCNSCHSLLPKSIAPEIWGPPEPK
jgi:hypothetical protein